MRISLASPQLYCREMKRACPAGSTAMLLKPGRGEGNNKPPRGQILRPQLTKGRKPCEPHGNAHKDRASFFVPEKYTRRAEARLSLSISSSLNMATIAQRRSMHRLRVARYSNLRLPVVQTLDFCKRPSQHVDMYPGRSAVPPFSHQRDPHRFGGV